MNCSPWTIRDWIKSGRLSAEHISRRMVRIPKESLITLIEVS
jgi:excisionase family DNA binding protein